MYEDYDMPYDHGFDEPDVQFAFFTTEDQKIEWRKNRNWFRDDEDPDFMDFYITWTLLVDGSDYMTFPKGTSEEAMSAFVSAQFEEDKEATEELNESYAIQEAERRMGA